MRRILVLVVFVVVTAVACKSGSKKGSVTELVARAFAFEGEIEMEMRVPSVKPVHTIYKLKGQKARVSGSIGPVIADVAEKKVYLLDDTAKSFKVFDFSAVSSVDAGAPAYKRTGRKDVVAGYACDEYELFVSGSRIETCATTAIYGPFATAAGALGAFGSDIGFPLRTISRDASGTEILHNEVLRIDKRPMPESDFVIPKGYTETP